MSRLKSARGASTGAGTNPKQPAAKPTRGATAKGGAAKAAPGKAVKGAKTAPVSGSRGRPGILVQKPKSDIFVVLLGVSLAAILLGTLALFLVFNRYPSLTPPM